MISRLTNPFHRGGELAHQREGYERFKDEPIFALWWDMRCRKTSVPINIFAYHFLNGPDDPLYVDTLEIISLQAVKWVWPEEARKELPPEMLARTEFLVWESGKTGESKANKERIFALRSHPGPVVISMNAQAIATSEKAWKYLGYFNPRRRVMLVVDESSWASHWTAQTKRLLTLGGRRGRNASNIVVRAILDGTPVDESPINIYYPSEFLRPGLLGYSTMAAFKARYCEYEQEMVVEEINGHQVERLVPAGKRFSRFKAANNDPDPYDRFPIFKRYRNLDELRVKMYTFGSRVRREDVSDAPPKQYASVYFEMTPKQRAVYDRLCEEYVADLSNRRVTARDVLLRLTRLQMVARNFWPPERRGAPCTACHGLAFTDDGEDCPVCGGMGMRVETTALERIDTRNPALEALDDALGDEPFVVWCRFRQDVHDVMAELSPQRKVLPYFGAHTDEENQAAYEAFRAGELDGIVATIGGGPSHGKDLSRAATLIYYSNDYKLRLRRQSEDRGEGVLKKFSTSIVDLLAVGTRDEEVVAALRAKRELSAVVMGDPRPWFGGSHAG